MKNIFICGLSGSGKDTLAKHFNANGYNNMRLAETIKRIICEKENLTFDEIEEQKRTDFLLRKMHNDVADELGHKAHITRLKQLINKTSMDFQWMSEKQKLQPTCVIDVRADYEIETLLGAGFIGIFLSRTTAEYRQTSHYTEQNMFQNGKLKEYVDEYPNQCIIVFNDVDNSTSDDFTDSIQAANNSLAEFENVYIPKIDEAIGKYNFCGINIHRCSDNEK